MDIPLGDIDGSTSIEDHSTLVISGSTVYPYGTTESFPHMVDTAGNVAMNSAHAYAECSNKGLCDRNTGQCECLPGYDGHACQRASCPSKVQTKKGNLSGEMGAKFLNTQSVTTSSVFSGSFNSNIQENECSGHGTCHTIQELAMMDYNNEYELWDKESSMGCKCDPGYTGPDCSERQCPYGIDPLWVDDTTAKVTQTVIRITTSDANTLGGTYAIRFYDVFGEDFVTDSLPLSPTGEIDSISHCDTVTNALKALPNKVIPDIECNQSVIDTDHGIEYVLKFIGNPGKLKELELIENLDGSRPTITVSSGTYSASVYTKVQGEFVDYFAEKCEGVTLKVLVDSDDTTNAWNADVRPGSIGYLADLTEVEVKLLKACLGHSDYDPDNNVGVVNWDEGALIESEGAGPDATYKMIGAFPHAIKVVPVETSSGYNIYTPPQYYLVWYDSSASAGKEFRVANVNDNNNDLNEATESYVFTTKGTVQQLGYGIGTELADNTSGGLSTDRIVGYFDAYSKKVYTNYDTSCENQPLTSPRNHVCLNKGDKLFIIDSCWGKGNSGSSAPVLTNPFFGGSEVSCSDSTTVNHSSGNLYTVTKVYKNPLLSPLSTDEPRNTANINEGEPQQIVDTYVIEVDISIGWDGGLGDPENSDVALDGTTWSDNSGIVTLFHFYPAEGSDSGNYEYVSECSNRGLCDSNTGQCQCFSGYKGFACSIQDAYYSGERK